MAFQLSPGVNVTEIDLTTVVPAVATSTGAIAGIFNWGPVNERVLIDTETKLASIFGRPSNNNAETWFTAADFLSYGNSLFVVRAANTISPDPSQHVRNAYANTLVVIDEPIVLNQSDYANNDGNFDSEVYYVAKYPGVYGNSLRISVCDTSTAYSSNIYMIGLDSSANVDVEGLFTIDIGDKVGYFEFIPGANGSLAEANSYARDAQALFTVGDIITVGNSEIGLQGLQVANISSVTSNSTGGYFELTFTSPYRLSTDFVADITDNSVVTRSWEFSSIIGIAPGQSDYVAQYGNTAAMDELHVVVVDEKGVFSGRAGSILESYVGLSRAEDAITDGGATNYYKTVINETSKYVWFGNDRAGAVSNSAVNVISSINEAPMTLQFVGGRDGFTEANVNLSTIAKGYDQFISAEAVDIALVLQGKPIGGVTVVNGQSIENFQLANYIIDNICETRKDCIALISPDDKIIRDNAGNEAFSLVNWRGALRETSYAVMDSGYKYRYDKYNDVYRYVPMNGDIAGLCVRTDNTRDPWWSPAGFNRGQIKNIVKLRWNPSKADRDVIYPKGINPVVTFPGQGTVLYGDRTLLSKPSAFDRINVRRLFIVLEKAIATAAKFFLFEFNDEFTRAQFRALINPYLRDIQGRRGITDYLVVCDTTNNTPEVIDTNRFIGDIYIKPARSINFIQLNFVAVRTGVQFSEIVGKF